MPDGETFDCFLSHNSRDQPAVRALAAHLRARGLTVWLDEEQLRPGLSWQPLLESGIGASRSVAVLVGADGLGPWEQEEMHAALTLAVSDKRPVIPVLLSDAPAVPKLPLFLRGRTWVDLRAGADTGGPAGLDQLVWGITGRRSDGALPVAVPENSRLPPAAPVDEASRRVSELRGALFLARSLDELKRLRNRVKALAQEFRSHPDVMDLADDVGQAIAAERRPVRSYDLRAPLLWLGALALVAVGTWIWNRLQPVPPGPDLVNRPTPEWIAEWQGEIDGLGGPGAAPVGLRIKIGAARSLIEVARRDRPICTAAVAVEVVERYARIWTDGDIPCTDGTRLSTLELRCEEAASGAADCTGRYAIDRPIRVALTRVGGGSWPARPQPRGAPGRPAPVPEPGAGDQPKAVPNGGPGSPGAAAVPALPLPTAPETQAPKGVVGGTAPFSDAMKIGGQAPEMIALPAGCFQMGSPLGEPERWDDEGPRHSVCVGAFAMGRTEVTFAQYDRFAAATGRRKPDDRGWGRGDRPVIDVSWVDASAYAAWLAGQTGQPYRLPSEAEWEYAARAGTETPFWTGACIHTDQANYAGNADYNGCGAKTGVYRERTVTVGSLPPNPWGLYEVAGNVWEWVQDAWHDNYQGAPDDGSAWEDTEGRGRVLRGGSWIDDARGCRSADRDGIEPANRLVHIGLRLSRGSSPPGRGR